MSENNAKTENGEIQMDLNANIPKDLQINPIFDPFYIDLTEEEENEEPAAKKIVLNSFEVASRIANHSKTVYRPLPRPLLPVEDEPGPSWMCPQQQHKRGDCSKCGNDGPTVLHPTGCGHRICYRCLVSSLKLNQATTNTCPLIRCQQKLSNEAIKKVLTHSDYVYFLEHTCDNLRRALQAFEPSADVGSPIKDSPTVTLVQDEQVTEIDENLSQNDERESERRRSELLHLQNLDAESYVKNFEPFDCPICFNVVAISAGVTLKNCLHSFCIECICETVKHSEEPVVTCPYNSEHGSCEFFIQDREIRALVSTSIYDLHLSKALKRGEVNLENIFHCKTPDCIGFIQHANDTNAFNCEVCEKVNCIKCSAIHEDKNCEQYQFDLKNDAKNQQELQLNEEAVKDLIEKGEVRKKS